jgi:hypothetical protein
MEGIEMTEEEYLNKMKEIDNEKALFLDEIQKKRDRIRLKYALQNKQHSYGDVVKDSSGFSFIVDKIKWGMSFLVDETPRCLYEGFVLKKDGTYRKDKKRGYATDK